MRQEIYFHVLQAAAYPCTCSFIGVFNSEPGGQNMEKIGFATFTWIEQKLMLTANKDNKAGKKEKSVKWIESNIPSEVM